jgi:hypothetical protein
MYENQMSLKRKQHYQIEYLVCLPNSVFYFDIVVIYSKVEVLEGLAPANSYVGWFSASSCGTPKIRACGDTLYDNSFYWIPWPAQKNYCAFLCKIWCNVGALNPVDKILLM